MRHDTRDATADQGVRATEDPRAPATPWWQALKNVLVEDDPVARARSRGARKPAPESESAPAATPSAKAHDLPAPPLSPMAQDLLQQVLSRATAYTALTEKLRPLEPVVADERTRYQAAFALIKGSRTLDQVVQAIDLQHVGALEAEVARFAGQLKETEQREIAQRAESLRTLDAGIDARHQEITRLREQLEAQVRAAEDALQADRDRVAQVTREIEDRRQEIAAVQARFDAATREVKDQLAAARDRVLRHLG